MSECTRAIQSSSFQNGNNLTGYAVLWDSESRDIFEVGRKFTEKIERGAFGALDTADVKLFYNHDSRMPLARTKSGTLKLTQDERGLKFDASLPDTSDGRDVRALLERGDLTGEMSFGFFVEKDVWTGNKRSIQSARLTEISIVQDAAYPHTHSALRHVAEAEIALRQIALRRRTWM
jgi:hypothetical protein